MPIAAYPRFRQVNARCGAFAGFAVELHRAAVQFDKAFRQRQPEPDTVMSSGETVADLPERRQGDRYLIRRHADACVLDLKCDATVSPLPNPQPDLAAR